MPTNQPEPLVESSAFLKKEFTRRVSKNSKYSLRAFARSIKLSNGYLSRVFNGERKLSLKQGEKISHLFQMETEEKERFLKAIIFESLTSNSKTRPPTNKNITQDYREISLDCFNAISEWHHFAITELTFLKSFKSDPAWIGNMLGIPEKTAIEATNRLIRLGIMESKNGVLRKTNKNLNSPQDVTSIAVRRFNREILSFAAKALDSVSLERRDITTITMAIDPKRIKPAKEKIKRFRRNLCAYLEGGRQKQIYNLAICLIPLSKESK